MFDLSSSCFRGFVLLVLEYCSAVWCSAADTHLKLLDRIVSFASFFYWGCVWVWPCTSSHSMVRCCDRTWVNLCTSLLQNLAVYTGLLFPFQYLCGTILVTQDSMVWDWQVSRAGPIPFYWPSCLLPFYLLLFSISLLSFYGLVLWGWSLRTDSVKGIRAPANFFFYYCANGTLC